MNDYKEEVNNFNAWYALNYNKIIKWANRNKISIDTVHDSYLKIVERITKVGYTGTAFTTYVKLSAKNFHINEVKKDNNIYFVDYEDRDWRITVEGVLQEFDEVNNDNTLYQNQLMFFSKNLFDYLESQNYSCEEMFVFKTYYLSKNRFTYKMLTNITGINKNRCTKIITTMKADIKNNLMDYINNKKDANVN